MRRLRFFLCAGVCIAGLIQSDSIAQGLSTGQSRQQRGVIGQKSISRRDTLELQQSTVQVGSIGLRFSAGLDIEYNDNVHLSGGSGTGPGKESDLFITPTLGVDGFWPITDLNQIRLRMEAGYEFSVNGTRDSASRFTISPDSDLSIRASIGSLEVIAYDRFGLENNPVTTGTVAQTEDYSLFTNITGVALSWNLNDLELTAGYEFVLNRSLGTSSGLSNDRNTHAFSAAANLRVYGIWNVGLEASFLTSRYQGVDSKQDSRTIGPFVSVQITPHTSIMLAGGLQWFDSQGTQSPTGFTLSGFQNLSSPSAASGGDDTLLYWQVEIQNRFNTWYSHALSAGQERQVALGADYSDTLYLRYTSSWLLFPRISLNFESSLEALDSQLAEESESALLWSSSVGFGWSLSPKLQAQLAYQYTYRDSDVEDRSYTQNVISLSLEYQF